MIPVGHRGSAGNGIRVPYVRTEMNTTFNASYFPAPDEPFVIAKISAFADDELFYKLIGPRFLASGASNLVEMKMVVRTSAKITAFQTEKESCSAWCARCSSASARRL
jgi:hypothetical protein